MSRLTRRGIHIIEREDGKRTVYVETHNRDSVGEAIITTPLTVREIEARLHGLQTHGTRRDRINAIKAALQ